MDVNYFNELIETAKGIGGEPGDFFTLAGPYLAGMFIWLFVIKAFTKAPFISSFIKEAEVESIKEFKETPQLLMLPKRFRLFAIYWPTYIITVFINIYLIVHVAVYWGYAIRALTIQRENFNNFTAAIILVTIGLVVAWFLRLSFNQNQQLFKLIYKTHNNSLHTDLGQKRPRR